MDPRGRVRSTWAAALLFISITFTGCGAGGSDNSTSPPPPPPPPPVNVSVAPPNATIALGATQQFTATVANSANTAVTWTVNGIAGGNSATGTINASGLYTAPQILPAPASVTIGAVSVANTSASASAIVTIFSSFTFTMAGPSSLNAGASAAYTATLTPAPGSNPSTAIAWSLTGNTCPACGTLITNGANATFTAPQTNSAVVVTITATPAADPTKAASVSVTINPIQQPPITVVVSPASATIAPLATLPLSATVTGAANTSVTWDVNGIVGGNPTLGTVANVPGTSSTIYTAPAAAPVPATVTIEARSNVQPSAAGSASVTITSVAPALAITQLLPTSAFAGASGNFDLQVIGGNLGVSPTIFISGTARSTTCSNSNQCSAVLTQSDLASAGNLLVFVQNASSQQSNTLDFVVAQETNSAGTVPLTSANPAATGQNISVVDASTAGSLAPLGNVTLAIQAMGLYVPSTQTCTLGGSSVVLQRPASGSATIDICVFSISGLDPGDTFTITGPTAADVTIVAQQPLGLGIIDLTLNVPASAAVGARSLFVENVNKDKAVATGSLEVR